MNTDSIITFAELFSPVDNLPSTARLRSIVRRIQTPYLILNLTRNHISITPMSLSRFAMVARETGAAMIYTDYRLGSKDINAEICKPQLKLPGSLSETMDFGHAVMIDTNRMRVALSKSGKGWLTAGFYDLWLRLSRAEGGIFYLPETLYSSIAPVVDHNEEVAEKNESEFEEVFAGHLKSVGAWLGKSPVKSENIDSKSKVSIIMSLTGSCPTVYDSIKSALSQITDFEYNIIVVENQTDEETSGIIRELSKENPKVIVIRLKRRLMTGGCWNTAVAHRLCGDYAVRLGSGECFDGKDSLQNIVDAMKSACADIVLDGEVGVEWRNQLLRTDCSGALRAIVTDVARTYPASDVDFGWDYSVALPVSRAGIAVSSGIAGEKAGKTSDTSYADALRTVELRARLHLIHGK